MNGGVSMAKFCENCGAELNEEQDICLKCGSAVKGKTPSTKTTTVAGEKNNSMATAGFIMAIVSLFLNFWGIVGILATVLSGVGLSQIKNSNEKGKGLAIAGLIIGIFSIFYGLIQIINLIELFA